MRLTLKPRTCQVIERNIMIARHLKDLRLLLRLQSILLWSNDEELEKIDKILFGLSSVLKNGLHKQPSLENQVLSIRLH